jgi:hypothetical protein
MRCKKPRRDGSLERGEPTSAEAKTLRGEVKVACGRHRKLVRGSSAKVERSCRGGEPWRAQAQGSYVLGSGLNRRLEVADSRVEKSPEGEGRWEGHGDDALTEVAQAAEEREIEPRQDEGLERQEGNGAGDGVRLHERRKASKGETPRADLA